MWIHYRNLDQRFSTHVPSYHPLSLLTLRVELGDNQRDDAGPSRGGGAGRSAPADSEAVEFETSKDVKVVNSFDKMGLKEDLLRGIYAYGFEKPSAIQQRAIMPIINGRDVIAQAQSGTGEPACHLSRTWANKRMRFQII